MAVVSCVSLEKRMMDARNSDCRVVVDEHEDIKGDRGYADTTRATQEAYEREVAYCLLEAGSADKAVAISKGWRDGTERDRFQVEARAYARMGKHVEARRALEELAKLPILDPSYFVKAPEFDEYAKEGWFLSIAIYAFSKSGEGSLGRYVRDLTARSGIRFLPLGVAAADKARPGGDFVLWTGIVRSARIDREKKKTVLFVEGANVKEELRAIDRRVDKVEGKVDHYQFNPFQTKWETTPRYSTERIYAEHVVPNGQHFVVEYSGISERMATMRLVVAFGRYSGRDSNGGRPVVTAEIVAERKVQQRSETHAE